MGLFTAHAPVDGFSKHFALVSLEGCLRADLSLCTSPIFFQLKGMTWVLKRDVSDIIESIYYKGTKRGFVRFMRALENWKWNGRLTRQPCQKTTYSVVGKKEKWKRNELQYSPCALILWFQVVFGLLMDINLIQTGIYSPWLSVKVQWWQSFEARLQRIGLLCYWTLLSQKVIRSLNVDMVGIIGLD